MTAFRYMFALFLLISVGGRAQVINLEGQWKFRIGDDQKWAMQYFNDTSWESIRVPSAWEDEGFNGYDGFAWYRIRFDGSQLDKLGSYYLNLGYIDDADEVYFNGEMIGFSGSLPPHFKTAYNNERKYNIPTELINFSGGNSIAVRVFDAMHGGGIVDGSIGIFNHVSRRQLLVDLQGVWMFATARTSERVDERAWKKIMVPSPWEFQGFLKYDGYAWYRKRFEIPRNLPGDPLVLLLGKIDDFDEVYINGTFIGRTNDRRPYGSSSSYLKDRVYDIPEGLLRREGGNVLEVLVHDMGNIGGIYEGPVGIMTKTGFERYLR